jgi:uncharacterized membrane protein YgaE (UPF0421/DUF939 family)
VIKTLLRLFHVVVNSALMVGMTVWSIALGVRLFGATSHLALVTLGVMSAILGVFLQQWPTWWKKSRVEEAVEQELWYEKPDKEFK